MSRPPQLAELLLTICLPATARGAALGDLSEEWVEKRDTSGWFRAWLWYWSEAFSLARFYVWERYRHGWNAEPLSTGMSDGVRREKGDGVVYNFVQDLRYGVRMLLKKPGFAVIATLALGLGVGANTAIFSVINAVMLRPLPLHEPERLVQLWESNARKGWNQNLLAPANFFDWRDQSQRFESMAAYEGSNDKQPGVSNVSLTGQGEAERLSGLGVTDNFFSVLGARPLLGRGFLPEDGIPDAPRVVVLSEGLWQRRFGGASDIIGRSMTFNGSERTIVGVMPRDFQFPSQDIELWSPMRFNLEEVRQSVPMRRGHWLWAFGRLKPGVSLAQAREELSVIAKRLEQQYPDTNEGMEAGCTPLQEWMVGDVRLPLLVLLGAVGFVLLVCCANLVNLLLARAASRKRELAVRSALGASRARLLGQMLTETLILAVLGCSVGLLIGQWLLKLLLALGPADLPRRGEIGIDGAVLLFTLAMAVFTALLVGLVPALGGSRPNLTESLKDGGSKGSAGLRARRARAILVIAEVGLASVLVIGAGLLLRSLSRLVHVEPGFSVESVMTMEIALPNKYQENPQVAAFFDELLQKTAALPGVRAAGAISLLPLRGTNWTSDVMVEGRSDVFAEARHKVITPDYFAAIGVPVISGRTFTAEDRGDSPKVVVVNETLARAYFGKEDPVGRRLKNGKAYVDSPWRLIVGVVRDGKQDGLGASVKPEIYEPHAQGPWNEMTLVVRSAGADAAGLTAPIRQVVQQMDRDVLIHNVHSMEEVVATSVARERFLAQLLSGFAALALGLASLGLYGVIAYSVSQRTQEIGIRMALGAGRGDVMRLVMGQGLGLVAVGVALGLLGAFGLTRFLQSLLFEVSATDLTTFVAVPALLAAVAMAACYVPARRAMRVDPISALRYE